MEYSSNTKCCVLSCPRNYRDRATDKTLHFYSLGPIRKGNQERCKLWMQALDPTGKRGRLSDRDVVCSTHFDDNDFLKSDLMRRRIMHDTWTRAPRLKDNAYPHKNLTFPVTQQRNKSVASTNLEIPAECVAVKEDLSLLTEAGTSYNSDNHFLPFGTVPEYHCLTSEDYQQIVNMEASTSIQDMESVTVKIEPEIKLEPMDDDTEELQICTQSLIKIEDGPKMEEPEFPFASVSIKSEETSPVKENVVKFEFVDEVQCELETDPICVNADPLDVDSCGSETPSKCYALNLDSISFTMVQGTEPYRAEPIESIDEAEEELGNISFQCNRCNQNIYTYEGILSHFRQLHKLVLQCDTCSLQIHSAEQLLNHVTDLGVVDVKSFMKKRFEGFINAGHEKIQQQKAQLLKKVILTYTSHSTPTSYSTPTSHSKSCVCLFCNKMIPTAPLMWIHLHKVHHYCSTCCAAFSNSSQFNKHKIQHENEDIRFFACQKCKKKLKTLHQMEQHWKLHHASKHSKIEYERFSQFYMEFNDSGFYCPYCFSFSQKEPILHSHMQLHQLLYCSHCKCKFITNCRDKDTQYCTNCNMNSVVQEPKDPTSAPLDHLLKTDTEVGIPLNSYLGQILQAQMNTRTPGNMNKSQESLKIKLIDDSDESVNKSQESFKTKLIDDSDADQSVSKKMRMQDHFEDAPLLDKPETSASFVHTDESRAKLMSEIPKDCPLYKILKASMQSSKNANKKN